MSRPSDKIYDDYEIDLIAANALKGALLMPHDLRVKVLTHLSEMRSERLMIELFSQFIGLANSVLANSRDFLEIAGIVYGDLGPYEAEKINFPTLFGALNGLALTQFGCDKCCSGCAFVKGTHANQSPSTTIDADWCGDAGQPVFSCHEDVGEDGEPTKICQGWLRMRQARKRMESLKS